MIIENLNKNLIQQKISRNTKDSDVALCLKPFL